MRGTIWLRAGESRWELLRWCHPIEPHKMNILILPPEIVTIIFSYIDPSSAAQFCTASKSIWNITKHPATKAKLLLTYYGRGQALYSTYLYHREMLDGSLAQIMVQNHGLVPRFLAQLVVKDVKFSIYIVSIKISSSTYYLFLCIYCKFCFWIFWRRSKLQRQRSPSIRTAC